MSPDLIGQWGPAVLGFVFTGGLSGFLAVVFNRRLTKATAGKTVVEGEVALSANDRAWVQQARDDAKAAHEDAKQAREDARTARADAESCRRSAWAAEDTAARCRREADELRDFIRDCARAGCPIRPLVAPRDDDA